MNHFIFFHIQSQQWISISFTIKPEILTMAYNDHSLLTPCSLLNPWLNPVHLAFISTPPACNFTSWSWKVFPQVFKGIPPSLHSEYLTICRMSYYSYQQHPEHFSICPNNTCHRLTSYTYLCVSLFLLKCEPLKAQFCYVH